MPENWIQFREQNTTEALRIQRLDPQLVSLLDGQDKAAAG